MDTFFLSGAGTAYLQNILQYSLYSRYLLAITTSHIGKNIGLGGILTKSYIILSVSKTTIWVLLEPA